MADIIIKNGYILTMDPAQRRCGAGPLKRLEHGGTAKLIVPKKQASRKVCVKAVDVFGFESVAVLEMK